MRVLLGAMASFDRLVERMEMLHVLHVTQAEVKAAKAGGEPEPEPEPVAVPVAPVACVVQHVQRFVNSKRTPGPAVRKSKKK